MTAAAIAPRARIAPLGLFFLTVTSLSWGLAWPVSKFLLAQWPPLSLRGLTGVTGGLLLAGFALGRGYSLRVPRSQWPALLLSSFLNVTIWVSLIGLALLWLPASEAAVITATMPVWTTALAWFVIGERMTPLRLVGLAMGIIGIVALMGGNGVTASLERAPGIALALLASVGFALGVVLSKRRPLALPLEVGAAWQVVLGCLPVALAGIVLEHPNPMALDTTGWILLSLMATIQFCVAYLCWFGAVTMLPASVAAIGTLSIPVIGVVASAVSLHEALGPIQIAALVFALAGVVLATKN
jgi:drug/metabolite transporter (DMT)-like permease